MLYSILLLLVSVNAHAEAPATASPFELKGDAKIPQAMKAKWTEVSTEVKAGIDGAKLKLETFGREDAEREMRKAVKQAKDSSFAHSVSGAASRLWSLTKKKSRHLLGQLDRKLHEKVLDDSGSEKAEK